MISTIPSVPSSATVNAAIEFLQEKASDETFPGRRIRRNQFAQMPISYPLLPVSFHLSRRFYIVLWGILDRTKRWDTGYGTASLAWRAICDDCASSTPGDQHGTSSFLEHEHRRHNASVPTETQTKGMGLVFPSLCGQKAKPPTLTVLSQR